MRTSIGGRITLPARPTEVGDSKPEDLQALRDEYMGRLIEQIQEASAVQRRLTKVEHEIGRLERTIKNIDELSALRGIELATTLRD